MPLMLAAACGGSRPRIDDARPFGGVPSPAVAVWVRPADADWLRFHLDDRLGAATLDELGPVGVVWHTGGAWIDAWLEIAAPGAIGYAGVAARWGADPGRSIDFTMGAVDGEALLEAFVAVTAALASAESGEMSPEAAQGQLDATLAGLPAAVWHGRVRFGVTTATGLVAAAADLAARAGWALWVFEVASDAPPPGFPAHDVGARPPHAVFAARDPQTGCLVVGRVRGSHGALDVLMPGNPRFGLAKLGPLLERETPVATPIDVPPRAPVALRWSPIALANLEASLAGNAGLRVASAGHQPPRVMATAVGFARACRERVAAVGAVAESVALAIGADDGNLTLDVDVRLRAAGARAWAAAYGPPVLRRNVDAVGGFELRVGRRQFRIGADAVPVPVDAVRWWEGADACASGALWITGPLALAVLPGLAVADVIPLPAAPHGPLAGPMPDASAALVLGFEIVDGEPVTRIGAAAIAPSTEVQRDAEPLGSDARLDLRRTGPRWSLDDPGLAVAFERRTRADGRELVLLALGRGALDQFGTELSGTERAGSRAEAVDDRGGGFLRVWVDPSAMARQLRASGRSGAAIDRLDRLGGRFGVVRVDGALDGRVVRYRLRAGAKLDRPRAGG